MTEEEPPKTKTKNKRAQTQENDFLDADQIEQDGQKADVEAKVEEAQTKVRRSKKNGKNGAEEKEPPRKESTTQQEGSDGEVRNHKSSISVFSESEEDDGLFDDFLRKQMKRDFFGSRSKPHHDVGSKVMLSSKLARMVTFDSAQKLTGVQNAFHKLASSLSMHVTQMSNILLTAHAKLDQIASLNISDSKRVEQTLCFMDAVKVGKLNDQIQTLQKTSSSILKHAFDLQHSVEYFEEHQQPSSDNE